MKFIVSFNEINVLIQWCQVLYVEIIHYKSILTGEINYNLETNWGKDWFKRQISNADVYLQKVVHISPVRSVSHNSLCVQYCLWRRWGRFCLPVVIFFHRSLLFLKMMNLSEQRAAIKFCFLLRKIAADTVIMLKTAYKDDALRKR